MYKYFLIIVIFILSSCCIPDEDSYSVFTSVRNDTLFKIRITEIEGYCLFVSEDDITIIDPLSSETIICDSGCVYKAYLNDTLLSTFELYTDISITWIID